MTHEEWVKKVKHALIDKDMNITQMAVAIGKSPEWARQCLAQRPARATAVKEISEYLGIKNYVEGRKK